MHPVILAYWPWGLIALAVLIITYVMEKYDGQA